MAEILEGQIWHVENWEDAEIHFDFQCAVIKYDSEYEEITICSGRFDSDDAVEIRTHTKDLFDGNLIDSITINDNREITIYFSNDDEWHIEKAKTWEELQKIKA